MRCGLAPSTGCPEPMRLDQTALDLYARSGRNLFEQAVVESGDIGHDLNVAVNDRTVVDGDEGHVFLFPRFGPYPSFDDHVRSRRLARSEQLRDFRSAVWHISSFSSLRVIRFLHRDNEACSFGHGTESGSERKYRKFNSKVVFPGSENGCRRTVRPGIGFLLLVGGAVTQAGPNPVGSGAWIKLGEEAANQLLPPYSSEYSPIVTLVLGLHSFGLFSPS